MKKSTKPKRPQILMPADVELTDNPLNYEESVEFFFDQNLFPILRERGQEMRSRRRPPARDLEDAPMVIAASRLYDDAPGIGYEDGYPQIFFRRTWYLLPADIDTLVTHLTETPSEPMPLLNRNLQWRETADIFPRLHSYPIPGDFFVGFNHLPESEQMKLLAVLVEYQNKRKRRVDRQRDDTAARQRDCRERKAKRDKGK